MRLDGHFIARLAALVPPPRVHLTRYHGVFAPHAALRAAITPARLEILPWERAGKAGALKSRFDESPPARGLFERWYDASEVEQVGHGEACRVCRGQGRSPAWLRGEI